MMACNGCSLLITCACYNELFVTVHVDDIVNTDSNKQYFVTVKYNIQKYIFL